MGRGRSFTTAGRATSRGAIRSRLREVASRRDAFPVTNVGTRPTNRLGLAVNSHAFTAADHEVTVDELILVDDFRFEKRLPSGTSAIRELLKRGLEKRNRGCAARLLPFRSVAYVRL
jgi:hypothetical protein